MYIAFKKCGKSFFEKCIKYFTKSEFIHCEIVTIRNDKTFFGYSAFPKEGVRSKWINNDDSWVFIHLKDYKASDIKDFFEKTKGKKYDYLGILGFVFGNKDNPNKYFCSEWCAKALKINNSSKVTPGWLYKYFKGQI